MNFSTLPGVGHEVNSHFCNLPKSSKNGHWVSVEGERRERGEGMERAENWKEEGRKKDS